MANYGRRSIYWTYYKRRFIAEHTVKVYSSRYIEQDIDKLIIIDIIIIIAVIIIIIVSIFICIIIIIIVQYSLYIKVSCIISLKQIFSLQERHQIGLLDFVLFKQIVVRIIACAMYVK